MNFLTVPLIFVRFSEESYCSHKLYLLPGLMNPNGLLASYKLQSSESEKLPRP